MYYVGMGRRRLQPKNCELCGDEYQPKASKQRFCGLSCVSVHARSSIRRKARDRYLGPKGVYMVRLPDGRRVAEHRQVYEKSRGVKLKPWHYVTWIDGDKSNNDPDNLTLSSAKIEEYVRTIGKLPAEMGRTICGCGEPKDVIKKTKAGQTRRYCRSCNRRYVRDIYYRHKNEHEKTVPETDLGVVQPEHSHTTGTGTA